MEPNPTGGQEKRWRRVGYLGPDSPDGSSKEGLTLTIAAIFWFSLVMAQANHSSSIQNRLLGLCTKEVLVLPRSRGGASMQYAAPDLGSCEERLGHLG